MMIGIYILAHTVIAVFSDPESLVTVISLSADNGQKDQRAQILSSPRAELRYVERE